MPPANRGFKSRRGFTILETSFALVVIGVGVLAFVEANQAFIRNNSWSNQTATAMYLANEIRERTRRLERHDPVTGLYLQVSGGTTTVVGWGREADETTIDDLDDIDDFNNLTFGEGGAFDGPINAFGEIIPQTDATGAIVTNSLGQAVPLRGWRQTVQVTKVSPSNFLTTRDAGYAETGYSVDKFPLRVTVIVEYKGPTDSAWGEVTRLVWVVPK